MKKFRIIYFICAVIILAVASFAPEKWISVLGTANLSSALIILLFHSMGQDKNRSPIWLEIIMAVICPTLCAIILSASLWNIFDSVSSGIWCWMFVLTPFLLFGAWSWLTLRQILKSE